ncbi:MAG: flagellar biosynthetic protein FliR [Anaerolineales bacterium]
MINIAQFQLFFLTFTRIMATIIHVPVLGGRSIPNPVKIGLGLILAIFLTPIQTIHTQLSSLDIVAFSISIGREIVIGTIAGYAAVLAFGALQISGSLMGLGSGFMAGQILNPAIEENGTSLDQLFVTTSFLIFFVLNGHHIFLLGLAKTFEVLPINSDIPSLAQEPIFHLTSSMITTGVQMALPILGALLLSDLAMGLLARVAPQIQVFFLGIPLKIAFGLFALAIAIPALAPNVRALFNGIGDQMILLLGNVYAR